MYRKRRRHLTSGPKVKIVFWDTLREDRALQPGSTLMPLRGCMAISTYWTPIWIQYVVRKFEMEMAVLFSAALTRGSLTGIYT
jgi:hypothetical protein